MVTVERQESYTDENGRSYTPVKGFVDGVEKISLIWNGEITDEAVWETTQGIVIDYVTKEIARRGL